MTAFDWVVVAQGRKTGYVAQGSVAKLTLGGMAAKFTKDQKFSHSKWQSLHVFLG